MPNEIMRGNVAPSAASLLPNPYLYTLPRELWSKVKDFFGYTINFVSLAASATQTVQTVIQNDSAFVAIALAGTVTDTTDQIVSTFVPQLIQLQDQTAGRNFFDAPAHYMNVVGTGQQPTLFTLPRLIKPGATISTSLTNLEATARNVRIVMLGFKVFNIDGNA